MTSSALLTPDDAPHSLPRLQQHVLRLASQLRDTDQRLGELIDCLDLEPGTHARQLAAALHTVRHDLLDDAIETLRSVGQQSLDDVNRRQQALERVRVDLLRAVS